MSGWEITAPILLGVLLLGVLIFSILKPSSVIKFGIFIERKILNGEKPEDEAPTDQWPKGE